MARRNRSRGRNVHFYDALDPDHALGGLILNRSVTEKTFLFMLGILLAASDPYTVVLRCTDEIVTPSDKPLKPGHYDIRSNSPGGRISLADEPCVTRSYSDTDSGTTNDEFQNQVRLRDRKCVITGTVNTDADYDYWTGFEAAHVFPLSYGKLLVDSGLPRFTTAGINSCQNGLLMLTDIHQQFDAFLFSINPDDDYRIVCFSTDPFRVGGRTLDPICRVPNDERSVRDELLRWHFRQSVLVNMRGAGERADGGIK
ncbi:HNH endonuclease-domain-containing protein [Lipomyces tetrasporus]